MGRQKIRQLSLSGWSVMILVILSVVVLLSWVTYHFLQPFPPERLVLATGMEGGSYGAFGELYRQVLSRYGIRAELRPTSGAVENLRLLEDRHQAVEAGFVQGTVGPISVGSNLVSLGGLAYTPLWVFYNGREDLDDLAQLKGKRIAIGPEGSGVRKYALQLLKVAGVTSPPAEFRDLPYAEANRSLLAGRVDAIMTFGAPDNPLISELLHTKGIKLMSISEAEAYSRLFPDLSHVVLPKGIIDPARHDPPADVHLLSPTMNLIVRKDLHPALVYLLLRASVEIHSGATWLNKAGEFPNITRQDDPISEQAARFYRSGASWLYAYLPFWAATFADRLTLILITLGMIIVPLIGIAPWVYTWRNRSKYYPLYRELRKIDREIREMPPTGNGEAYAVRLDRMEDTVSRLRMSVAFYDELYILKEHIRTVRQRLEASPCPPGEKGEGSDQ